MHLPVHVSQIKFQMFSVNKIGAFEREESPQVHGNS